MKTISKHPSDVESLAWPKDGRLASAGGGSFYVWDPPLDQILYSYSQPSMVPKSLAWSQDGRLAVGKAIGIGIYQGSNYDLLKFPKAHEWEVVSVAWSSNGLLASGSWDGSVLIWSFDTGKPVPFYCGYFGQTSSVAWPDDDIIAAGASDGNVYILDSTDCLLLKT